jgi:hypothetical protein
MFAGGSGPALLTPALLGLALAAFAVEIASERGLPERASPALRAAAYVGLLLALELASDPGPPAQFVYFKF